MDRNLSYAEARAVWRAANKSRSYANTVQDRLRQDDSQKDKIIKMLQEEVESLRNVILELKTQIANLSNNNLPNVSTSTQSQVRKDNSSTGKAPTVALTRLCAC